MEKYQEYPGQTLRLHGSNRYKFGRAHLREASYVNANVETAKHDAAALNAFNAENNGKRG